MDIQAIPPRKGTFLNDPAIGNQIKFPFDDTVKRDVDYYQRTTRVSVVPTQGFCQWCQNWSTIKIDEEPVIAVLLQEPRTYLMLCKGHLEALTGLLGDMSTLLEVTDDS